MTNIRNKKPMLGCIKKRKKNRVGQNTSSLCPKAAICISFRFGHDVILKIIRTNFVKQEVGLPWVLGRKLPLYKIKCLVIKQCLMITPLLHEIESTAFGNALSKCCVQLNQCLVLTYINVFVQWIL